MVGLNWNDAFVEGNKLGLAFGSTPATPQRRKVKAQMVATNNFAIEAYYDYQVTDNISVTPAVFWVDDADGKASS